MALTDGWLAWSVTLLSLVTAAVLVWRWRSVAGDGPGWVLARTGALLGVNLLVVLSIAIHLNDQYLFFADWADLGGALGGGETTSQMHRGGSEGSAAEVPVSGPAAVAPAALAPLPAGTPVGPNAVSYPVTGPLSGVTGQVVVTAPVGVDPRSPGPRPLPVLETFSGYPGSLTQWVRTMQLPEAMAEQVAGGRMRPALIVSPQVELPAGADTECVDGDGARPRVETWVTRDVPQWIASHFRVDTRRSGWATIGLSAGGWCAAMAAMLHPSQYGGAVIMGGYFRPEFAPGADVVAPGSAAARRYDLVAGVKRSPPPVALWVETSHTDPVSYGSTAALLKEARPPLSVTAVVLQNAGHRIGVWQEQLPAALQWLGRDVAGFRP